MASHRDNHRYQHWNLEATAELLRDKYPTSNIYVMKPCQMHLGTFSVYSNFVTSNAIGVPDHKDVKDAWRHLSSLLKNAMLSSLNAEQSCDDAASTEFDQLYALPKHIVGFSKGCVVLNQLLYELKSALSDASLTSFIASVHSITWLDGGHSGHGNGEPTWVNDLEVLQLLQNTNVRVHVHVTPYQVNDAMRPWKGKEYKKFLSALRRLKINVTNTVHFEDEQGSIENHFQILYDFKNT